MSAVPQTEAVAAERAVARRPDIGAFHRRRELNEAARALLGVIADLQARTGWCFASEAYLADAIGVTDRYVRSLCSRLHEKGYLGLISRKGKPTLRRVIREADDAKPDGGKPVTPATRPRNKSSDLPRNKSSDPGRNNCSDYSNSYITCSASGGGLFERSVFDPFEQRKPRRVDGVLSFDDRLPQKRVADAFREGEILFLQHGGDDRLITAIQWSNHHVHFTLAVEGTEQGTEVVKVPIDWLRVKGRLWR